MQKIERRDDPEDPGRTAKFGDEPGRRENAGNLSQQTEGARGMEI